MRKAINIYRNGGLKEYGQDGKVRIYSQQGVYLGRKQVMYQGLRPVVIINGHAARVDQVTHRLSGNRRVTRWELM